MVHILEKTISLGLRIDMDESKFDIDEKHGKWHPKKRRIACCSSINQPVINTVMALEALFIATIDRDFKKNNFFM